MFIFFVILGISIYGTCSEKASPALEKFSSRALNVIYYIFSIVAIIGTRLFYVITKLLHIQSFMYYVLGVFGGLPSIIYMWKVHIPRSRIEKAQNSEDDFIAEREARNNTIAMIAFYPWSILAVGFLVYTVFRNRMPPIIFFIAALVYPFLYAIYKILDSSDENEGGAQKAPARKTLNLETYSLEKLIKLEKKTHAADVQAELGSRFFHGKETEPNYETAFEWYKKSACQGNAIGQFRSGMCCLKGSGTEQNDTEAFLWFERSAEQGYAAAQKMLGDCYLNGCGTEKDCKKAYEWLKKSAEQDYQSAKEELDKLPKMDTDDEEEDSE
ncbi:MAG: sel1 repeat family protein [Treponema sp.]|nr:sel1 repeat family protein [Treponema sp.]